MRPLLLTCLTGLTPDHFTLVAHALALVRVGLAQLADLGGDLADLLLVDALDREAGRRLDADGDAHARRDGNGKLSDSAHGRRPLTRRRRELLRLLRAWMPDGR